MQIQIARYISHTAVSALIIRHSDEKNCKISVKWCLFQKLVSAEIRAGRASKGLYVAVCFFGLFYSGHKAAVIQNTHCAVMTIALFFLVVHSCACGWCTGWRNQLQICPRWGLVEVGVGVWMGGARHKQDALCTLVCNCKLHPPPPPLMTHFEESKVHILQFRSLECPLNEQLVIS